MGRWFVVYTDEPGIIDVFVCSAEDEEHASEQCQNAYPESMVYGAVPENQGE